MAGRRSNRSEDHARYDRYQLSSIMEEVYLSMLVVYMYSTKDSRPGIGPSCKIARFVNGSSARIERILERKVDVLASVPLHSELRVSSSSWVGI